MVMSISALTYCIPHLKYEPVRRYWFFPEGGPGGFPVLDILEEDQEILICREKILLRNDKLRRLTVPGRTHISSMVKRFLEVLGLGSLKGEDVHKYQILLLMVSNNHPRPFSEISMDFIDSFLLLHIVRRHLNPNFFG
jgi:hypothetical protein